MPNFVEIRSNSGQDMAIVRFFQDGGRPPSWICYACVQTIHEGHLVVFITAQNLVGIDAVVLIIYNYTCYSISQVWLENAYSRPEKWGFGEILPPNGEQYQRNPQKAHPCASPRRLSHHA